MVNDMGVYAIVRDSVVVNIVAWDGDTEFWSPPDGETAVEVTTATGPATIRYTWDGTAFSPPANGGNEV